jgi:hypothetical protein
MHQVDVRRRALDAPASASSTRSARAAAGAMVQQDSGLVGCSAEPWWLVAGGNPAAGGEDWRARSE